MTIFVIAIGLYALIETGCAMGRASAGIPRTVSPQTYTLYAVTWAVIAGGALAALLV